MTKLEKALYGWDDARVIERIQEHIEARHQENTLDYLWKQEELRMKAFHASTKLEKALYGLTGELTQITFKTKTKED